METAHAYTSPRGSVASRVREREEETSSSPTTEEDQQYQSWGKSLALDLFECEHERLTDPDLLKKFVRKLVSVINMVAHGECYVDRFGDGSLEGYSAMQFIETSSVTVHLDEVNNRAFIDVFSCKDFDPKGAITFSKEFFGAKRLRSNTLTR